MTKTSLALVAVLAASTAFTQAPPAARGKASATIGGKAVTVDYGVAKLGKRTFDELLTQLPQDRMWRAGRNQVTTITTEGPLMVGGKAVPAGKYSLYVHVGGDGKYALAINKNLGVALKEIFAAAPPALANEPWPIMDDYTGKIGKDEVARVDLMATKAAASADEFSIALTPKGDGAALSISWGDKVFATDVKAGK